MKKKQIIFLVFLSIFMLAGCSPKKSYDNCFEVDIVIDLSPIANDAYDSALLELRNSKQKINKKLDLDKSIGKLSQLRLEEGLYSMVVSLFKDETLVARLPIKEQMQISPKFIVKPIFTLTIDDDEQKLFPVVKADHFAKTNSPVVLDGSLSFAQGSFFSRWIIKSKPYNSKIATQISEEIVTSVVFDYPGTYELALVLEDGAKSESLSFTIEVADSWLFFAEPVFKIASCKDGNIAVLHGVPAKLSVFGTLENSVTLGSVAKGLVTSNSGNYLAVWVDNTVRIYSMPDLYEIDSFELPYVVGRYLAITDAGVFYLIGFENNQCTIFAWSLDTGLKRNLFRQGSQRLFTKGEKVYLGFYQFMELFFSWQNEGEEAETQTLLQKTILCINDRYALDENKTLYKFRADGSLISDFQFPINGYVSQALFADSLLIWTIRDSAIRGDKSISVFDIEAKKHLQSWEIPRFQVADDIIAKDIAIINETVAVVYEPPREAIVGGSVIGFYNLDKAQGGKGL